jgi:hypothetical protein
MVISPAVMIFNYYITWQKHSQTGKVVQSHCLLAALNTLSGFS